ALGSGALEALRGTLAEPVELLGNVRRHRLAVERQPHDQIHHGLSSLQHRGERRRGWLTDPGADPGAKTAPSANERGVASECDPPETSRSDPGRLLFRSIRG